MKALKISLFFTCSCLLLKTISGQTLLPTNFSNGGSNVNMYYHDSVAYGLPALIRAGDTKIILPSPVFLFEANDSQTPYLVYPGENIRVQRQNANGSIFLTTKDPVRNNELFFFKSLVSRTGRIYDGGLPLIYHQKVKDLEQVHKLEQEIKNKRIERIQFLDSFSLKNKISENFRTIVTITIISTEIKDLLFLYRNNIELLKSVHLSEELIHKCISNLNSLEFSPFMPYYHACIQAINLSFDKSLIFNVIDSVEFKRKYDFISANFKKMPKYFLLSRCLFTAITNKIQVPQAYLDKYTKDCLDNGYRQIINAKVYALSHPQKMKGNGDLLTINGKNVNSDSILATLKNKLIFIDFWASWCAPCRNEMPASTDLRNKYKGKDIAFLFFSTDKNKSDWLKAIKEENLQIPDASFMVLNAEKSAFLRENNITTIPRYILLGKDGRVLSSDAPRPADQALISLINKNL